METSSFGQIVVLDDDMADRVIESSKTDNDKPFARVVICSGLLQKRKLSA